MTDLDAIKARVQVLQRHAGGTDYAAQVIADCAALVAELERLQSHAADCEQHAKFAAGKATALERAAVVAWLRDCALDPETTGAEMRLFQNQATTIERGEHRREGAP